MLPAAAPRDWHDPLVGIVRRAAVGRLALAQLFERLPLALLVQRDGNIP
jgi:hypothetical protein